MFTPRRIPRGEQLWVTIRIDTLRLSQRRICFFILLTLAWGFGTVLSPFHLQAQDGGNRSGQLLTVNYALEVDTRGLTLDRLCIDQTVSLPITVVAFVQVAGDANPGRVQVRGAVFTTATQNPAYVRAETAIPPLDTSPDVPFSARLDLTGLSAGRTTIDVSANIQFSTPLSFDEEVILPIPGTSQTPTVSVPVRVVPCDYRVSGHSLWMTNLFSASVLISVSIDEVYLTSSTGLTFRSTNPAFFELSITSYRFPLCEAYTMLFVRQPLTIMGEIIDDDLLVTIEYPVPYDRNELSCIGTLEPRVYRERGERGLTNQQEIQNFTPERLDIRVPLDGGTYTRSQTLSFKNGSADGSAAIIITPVYRE